MAKKGNGEDTAKALMPPPPPQPGGTKQQEVLEEDEYTQRIEEIVERDYYPELPDLQNKLEWIQARKSNDPEAIRTAQASIARRQMAQKPPGSEPSTPSLPETGTSDSGYGSEGGEDPSGDSHTRRGGRLDAFLAGHTGEDNASFREVMDKEASRRKARRLVESPRPGLFLAPPGVAQPPTAGAVSREVFPGNTRMGASDQEWPDVGEAEAGKDWREGRSLVATPSPSPSASEWGKSPMMTWGWAAETPERVERGDATPGEAGAEFRVQAPSKREETGRRLAPKMKGRSTLGGSAGRSPSQSPGKGGGVSLRERAKMLSPAGKQLLKKIATPKRSDATPSRG